MRKSQFIPAKHTPGPWAIRGGSEEHWIVQGDKKGPMLAKVPVKNIVNGSASFDDHAEADANCRLIAAAPELLAILAPFIEIWAKGGSDYAERMQQYWGYDNLHAAKDAITKALFGE